MGTKNSGYCRYRSGGFETTEKRAIGSKEGSY